MLRRISSNRALMGQTHSVSSVSIYLAVLAFYPALILKMTGSNEVIIYILSIFLIAGASLLPDLDNTKSTAHSTLGPVGTVFSYFFRGTSKAIQSVFSTNRDDTSNPHRGFWHTLVSVAVVFFAVWGSVSIPVSFALFGVTITIGEIFAFIWTNLCMQLAFSGAFSGFINKMFPKKARSAAVSILSVIFAVVAIYFSANVVQSYGWIAYMVGFGYLAHLLGDALTTSGVPLFWPLKIKGKLWYRVRLTKMKAGGDIEKYVILPFFIILGIASIVILLKG